MFSEKLYGEGDVSLLSCVIFLHVLLIFIRFLIIIMKFCLFYVTVVESNAQPLSSQTNSQPLAKLIK